MFAALPVEVHDARRFWVVMDSAGSTWVLPYGAGWAQRKPYRGGVRGMHRVDEAMEDLLILAFLQEVPAAA